MFRRLPLDELKTFQTLSGGILSNTEKRQIGIDNGELVITCADHDKLTSLKQKVKQIIKYGSSPVKSSVWIHYLTMYKILSSSKLNLDVQSNKPDQKSSMQIFCFNDPFLARGYMFHCTFGFNNRLIFHII